MFIRPAVAVAVIGAASIAACGGTSQTPQQVVLTAARIASTQSVRIDVDLTERLTASGKAASSFGPLAGKPITLTLHVDAVNAGRMHGTFTAKFAGRSFTAQVVVVSGHAYVSTDGTTFKSVPLGKLPSSQYGVQSALQYLNAMGTVSDAGSGTARGIAVERYKAQLDPSKMATVMKNLFSSLKSSSLQSLLAAMHFTGGNIEADVDHNDRLVEEAGSLGATFNLAAVSSSLSGSTLTLNAAVDCHFYDYGASITVTPPANVTGSINLP